MKTSKLYAALALSSALAASAHAASLTQTFNSSWTVAPWDYNGDIAAQQWQYLNFTPWDSALGTLLSVQISTTVHGTRDPADSMTLRHAFFTGWTPNQYQFSDSLTIAAGSSLFANTRTFLSGTDFPLSNFLSYLYLPQAYYYFESRSAATHSVEASTELVYNYRLISEPASELLMLVALSALAIVVRRRYPEQSG
jgi:hypothetical protein